MAPDAWAAGTPVVPITSAEGKLRGLPVTPQGRFSGPGSTLAQVGAVNGDGVADVAIAEPSVTVPWRPESGAGHVLFGGSALGPIDVGTAADFRILGPRQGARPPLPVFQHDGPPK